MVISGRRLSLIWLVGAAALVDVLLITALIDESAPCELDWRCSGLFLSARPEAAVGALGFLLAPPASRDSLKLSSSSSTLASAIFTANNQKYPDQTLSLSYKPISSQADHYTAAAPWTRPEKRQDKVGLVSLNPPKVQS